ncbi:GNAT family N-acetyltransferase [Lederbergia galactosidilytica]|uniref:Acetyltransferase n=1 Tax=Lederbergia galactosidilytica TaxID=217031 RepID=A0A177ZLE8_9BACI|nr:GNAT family N-acetyltransferase [Lederbergia galactosidilytica]KRG15979.1 acetyltransferase [Virgibacillus soli]OAK67708.1 acetyltransferase [Lederbergia galactosidilytica]
MQAVQATTEQQLNDAFYVRKKVFVEEQKVPLELEIDEFENESAHFILYNHDKPIGAGRFRMVEDFGKIERICILSSSRALGAGKKVMEAIEGFARKKAIQQLKLHAQITAIPFYEKLGYMVCSEEFMDAGIPHKTMTKQLNADNA